MKISLAFIWVIVSYFCTRDGFFRMGIGGWRVTVLWGAVIMVFCFQNCSELLWEKIVLMIEKIFWNSRLKPNNLQKIYSQTIRTILIQIRKNNWDLGTAGKVRKKFLFSGTKWIKIYMQQWFDEEWWYVIGKRCYLLDLIEMRLFCFCSV